MIAYGDAPCGGCGQHIEQIPVLTESADDDGFGGTWYEVDGEMECENCGEPLRVYHVPPKSE